MLWGNAGWLEIDMPDCSACITKTIDNDLDRQASMSQSSMIKKRNEYLVHLFRYEPKHVFCSFQYDHVQFCGIGASKNAPPHFTLC